MIKKLLFFLFFLTLAPMAFIPVSVHAETEEEITSFSSTIQVNSDSSINVEEEINYFFPAPRHGIYRRIPFRYKDESKNKNFKTPIENISVKNKGQNVSHSESEDGNYLEIKIGDPNSTVTGLQTYTISYKVTGVLNYFDDYDELYWNVTGNDWTVDIGKTSAEITLPNQVDPKSIKTSCYSGETGSKESSCTKNSNQNIVNFKSEKGPLTIVTGWNKGVVTPIERKYEIQIRHESWWYALIPLFTLIFLIIHYFRVGKDPFGRGTIAPEFEPPEDLRPAEMGTLIDEEADNKDITATIIDFAVRGFLKIREKNKKYTLVKLKSPDLKFKAYEKDIFDSLFKLDKEIDVEDLHQNFTELIEIKDSLYKNLTHRKYFVENPDNVRSNYIFIGVMIMIFCGALFWFSWILVFALGFSGLIVLIFSSFMPKKTREGAIAKEKVLGFKEFLYRAERYRVKWQEKENIFEKFLPYALVFGIAEFWAKNFTGIYKNPPDWYEGNFTTFNTVVLASSLNSFSTTASHSFSPPQTAASSGSSGFGGGGSSGGGFGGGGGGSW